MAIVEAGDEEYQDSYLGKIGAQQNGQREKVFLDDIAAAIDSIIGSIRDIKVDWKEVDFVIMKALEFAFMKSTVISRKKYTQWSSIRALLRQRLFDKHAVVEGAPQPASLTLDVLACSAPAHVYTHLPLWKIALRTAASDEEKKKRTMEFVDGNAFRMPIMLQRRFHALMEKLLAMPKGSELEAVLTHVVEALKTDTIEQIRNELSVHILRAIGAPESGDSDRAVPEEVNFFFKNGLEDVHTFAFNRCQLLCQLMGTMLTGFNKITEKDFGGVICRLCSIDSVVLGKMDALTTEPAAWVKLWTGVLTASPDKLEEVVRNALAKRWQELEEEDAKAAGQDDACDGKQVSVGEGMRSFDSLLNMFKIPVLKHTEPQLHPPVLDKSPTTVYEDVPHYLLNLVMARVEAALWEFAISVKNVAREQGYDKIFLDPFLSKDRVELVMKPVDSSLSLNFVGKVTCIPRKGAIKIAEVFGVSLYVADPVGKAGLEGEPVAAAWLVKQVSGESKACTTQLTERNMTVNVKFSRKFMGEEHGVGVNVIVFGLSVASEALNKASIILTRPTLGIQDGKTVAPPLMTHAIVPLPASSDKGGDQQREAITKQSKAAQRIIAASRHLLS